MFNPDRRFVVTAAAGIALASFLPRRALATGGMLEPAAMRGDIGILFDAYSSLHPGLYRYLTPARFARERRQLDALAATPRSLGDFYLALSAFTASIRCGHSYPNPANQTAAIAATLFDRPDRLPFAFRWVGGRMIVTGDLGSSLGVRRGDEVVAIDGVSASAMLARMLPYARTDGANDARKVADLDRPGDAEEASFDILRSLLFPAAGPAARLTVRRDGRTRTITCPRTAHAARPAASSEFPYGWRFDVRGTVGVLAMPTWAVFHDAWDWQGFIDRSIDTAIDRDLSGIVIDLRGNGGGLDCGAAILARLVAAPLTVDGYSRHVRYRAIPARLSPYLKTWDRSFRDWGTAAIGPDAAGFYRLDRPGDATDGDLITPAGRRYAGRAVVLIGPANASATFGFAALVKRHGLATLVGEPTGGNLRGINGGAFFFVQLPGSGIEVDLPLIAYWPDTPQPDAGVTPDVFVPVRPIDLRTGEDRQMGRALSIASDGHISPIDRPLLP